ncbi:MAG: SDR family oxidoreductase [Gammaproteobacteria bacterium]|nr:SDR family oxidoreductase [Gammaproteobacteria bacterium]MDD9871017.1 SDR family oxidoreductase [Gammaproteobacteria bacterium]
MDTGPLFRIDGKHAVVTGGGTGIGNAIAHALHSAGARITLAGRRTGVLQQAAEKLSNSEVFTWDLSAIDEIDATASQLAATAGAPDIVVNAAFWRAREPAAKVTPAVWRATLDTGLAAPFFVARAFAPAMCKRGWGRILNIASLQSRLAFTGGIVYGAAKGGIAQLTRAMAAEWSRHGVNANALAPGFFPTAMTAPLFDDDATAAALGARTAIGRNGELRDLHGAAVFLCAPASDYITGQMLFVDGGFTVT